MGKFVIFTIVGVVILVGLVGYDVSRFFDGKLHVVFCDVGQGDAIFIRTPSGKNILVDGGPDKKVLDCLADYMPFWERTIHLMFLSHPHDDHFAGMYYVIDNYTVLSFDSEKLLNASGHYNAFLQKVQKKNVPSRHVFGGDRFTIADGVSMHILGPDSEYLKETSPNGYIGERAEFASLISEITYGSFRVLLTGDSQAVGLHRVLQKNGKKSVSVLQIPHHGSKTGLDKDLIRILRPGLAIASVGKNNYGHPNMQLITFIEQTGTKVLRTDKEGSIEIVSDGKEGWMRKNNPILPINK